MRILARKLPGKIKTTHRCATGTVGALPISAEVGT